GAGSEDPSHVRRMLERRVEVHVVCDLERQVQGRIGERYARPVVPACGGKRVGPCITSECEQRVERLLCVDIAERREVDDLGTVAPADTWSAAAGRESTEAGHPKHHGGQRYTACRRAP